jgi:hypothetical protein
VLADFLIGDLADFFEQLAITAIDLGFLRDFEEPLGARVSAGMNTMADAGNELPVCQPFLDCFQRDAIEVVFPSSRSAARR